MGRFVCRSCSRSWAGRTAVGAVVPPVVGRPVGDEVGLSGGAGEMPAELLEPG